jgi:DNA-binding LacI/PurR family transcriptional regulator
VTSADVAAAAGVSRATVSYVLNGVHDRISEQTRARVLEAAERLGYVPNAMASALRAGRTEIVLLSLPSWPIGPAVAEWVSAGVAELEQLGYTTLVHFQQGAATGSFDRACDRVRPVALLAPGRDLPPDRVQALRENGTRAVLAIAPEPLEHVTTLVVNQAHIGELAANHLIERGHRMVVALMPSAPEFEALADARVSGAQATLDAHDGTLFQVRAACSVDAIIAALEPVLAQNPTALYAFNDDYAFEAIAALIATNHEVPGDVAVIGTDHSAHARRTGLTTIALGAPSGWPRIAARLHETIEGGDDLTPLHARSSVVEGTTT